MISRTTHPNYMRTDDLIERYDAETETYFRFSVDEDTGELVPNEHEPVAERLRF